MGIILLECGVRSTKYREEERKRRLKIERKRRRKRNYSSFRPSVLHLHILGPHKPWIIKDI
jgi:hypothetical protein